jgi:predicted GH43/DUF377 family glycosyl hydrolase
MDVKWEKLGNILEPQRNIHWLCISAGASFAFSSSEREDRFNLFVTGRDAQGRSLIGAMTLDMATVKVANINPEPVMRLGEKGAFDADGTSYPYIVRNNNKFFMYYTGWVRAVQVPWINELGLATSSDGLRFERYSRAPILPRNNEDFIGIGSSCIIRDEGKFKMWYTRFEKWGNSQNDHKHYYNIKYAESEDGIQWKRYSKICINFKHNSEYAISKPCVLKWENTYLMWYSYRGEFYKIGFATSTDGIGWTRKDELAGIECSNEGWDSQMICYPYVFPYKDSWYMLYNGNGYGSSGLGLARMPKETLKPCI